MTPSAAFAPAAVAAVLGLAALAGLLLASRFEPPAARPWWIVVPGSVAILGFLLAPPGVDAAFVGWSAALVAGLVALAAVDAASDSVPDILSLPLVALGLLHAWVRGLPVFVVVAAVALVILAAAAAALLPSRLRRGVGGGDVLLLAGALAWLGPGVAIDIVLLTAAFLLPFFAWRAAGGPVDGAPVAPALGAATILLWLNGPVF